MNMGSRLLGGIQTGDKGILDAGSALPVSTGDEARRQDWRAFGGKARRLGRHCVWHIDHRQRLDFSFGEKGFDFRGGRGGERIVIESLCIKNSCGDEIPTIWCGFWINV